MFVLFKMTDFKPVYLGANDANRSEGGCKIFVPKMRGGNWLVIFLTPTFCRIGTPHSKENDNLEGNMNSNST